MKIAIVGSGVAGLTAALLLHNKHEVVLFEAAAYFGGHVRTIEVKEHNKTIAIDTGFIVCNNRNYHNFLLLLDYLQIPVQKSSMSFSVKVADNGLEYNGGSVNGLFAQRKNLCSAKFWRLLFDIAKFNSAARKIAFSTVNNQTVAELVAALQLHPEFSRYYLLPMIAAIWSNNQQQAQAMPAKFICNFFNNHGLLNIIDRPQWYTIVGGACNYVQKIIAILGNTCHANTAIEYISRNANGVVLKSAMREYNFDKVIIATHANQALHILSDATSAEMSFLSKFKYANNEVALHTDTALLPQNKRAWASWNYLVQEQTSNLPLVTYNMNILQNLIADKVYCVSLNQTDKIAAEKIISTITFAHPIIDQSAINAQALLLQYNGVNNTYYCGAYCANGFHEDGVNSALRVVERIDKELLCVAPFILE